MSDRSTEIRVGILSIVSLLILVIGLGLGNNISFSTSDEKLSIQFPHSGGVKSGDPLMVNGVERGRVDDITNNANGVMILASIDDVSDLRSDAKARIMMFEITGGRKIEIDPGVSESKLDISKAIKGKTSANVSDLIAVVGDIAVDATMLIRRLDTLSNVVNRTMDEEFLMDIRSAAKEANSLIINANEILESEKDNLSTSIRDLRKLMAKLNTAVDKNEPVATELLADLKITVDKVNTFFDKTSSTIDGVDKLIADVDGLLKELKGNEATIGMLINDKEFAQKFDKALYAIGELLTQIQEHGINVNARLGSRPKNK